MAREEKVRPTPYPRSLSFVSPAAKTSTPRPLFSRVASFRAFLPQLEKRLRNRLISKAEYKRLMAGLNKEHGLGEREGGLELEGGAEGAPDSEPEGGDLESEDDGLDEDDE